MRRPPTPAIRANPSLKTALHCACYIDYFTSKTTHRRSCLRPHCACSCYIHYELNKRRTDDPVCGRYCMYEHDTSGLDEATALAQPEPQYPASLSFNTAHARWRQVPRRGPGRSVSASTSSVESAIRQRMMLRIVCPAQSCAPICCGVFGEANFCRMPDS